MMSFFEDTVILSTECIRYIANRVFLSMLGFFRDPLGFIRVSFMFLNILALSWLTVVKKRVLNQLSNQGMNSLSGILYFAVLLPCCQIGSFFFGLFLPRILKDSLYQVKLIFESISINTSLRTFVSVCNLMNCSVTRRTSFEKKPQKNSDHMKFTKRIGSYALKTYCASEVPKIPLLWMHIVSYILGIEVNNILYISFNNYLKELNTPNYILFKNPTEKEIVLAIRGTNLQDLDDLVTDLMGDEVPFSNGYAHNGIANSAHKIIMAIGSSLKEALDAHPDFKMVVTGHSLGAGVAELVTIAMLNGDLKYLNPSETDIKCIALAPPPVFYCNNPITNAKALSAIEIFINQEDIVPSLSTGVFLKHSFAVDNIINLGLSDCEIREVLTRSEASKPIVKMIRNAILLSHSSILLLHHPGTVYHICNKNNALTISQKTSDYFSAYLPKLQTRNFVDHFDVSYQMALLQDLYACNSFEMK